MWAASDWLTVLSAEARLVWVELLCYCKNAGRDGKVKALHPETAARMWGLGAESIRQLIKAAELHGALSIEGHDWVVIKWASYQGDPTAAKRQAKFKSKPTQVQGNGDNALPTVSNTEKEKEKEKDTEKTPKASVRLTPLSLLPIEFQTPEIAEAYKRYDRMRIEKKIRPWTATTVKERAAQWGQCEPSQVLAALQKSVSNGWQGVFPERELPSTAAVDDRERILANLKAEGYE